MWKIAAGVAGFLAIAGGIVAMFTVGVVAEVKTWCSTPCELQQTCDSLFTGDELCAEYARALHDHGWGDDLPPVLFVRWKESTIEGKRGWHDYWGRSVAGVAKGSIGMEVAHIPGDKVCNTAFRHEVHHQLLGLEGKDKDGAHKTPGWDLFDGCR